MESSLLIFASRFWHWFQVRCWDYTLPLLIHRLKLFSATTDMSRRPSWAAGAPAMSAGPPARHRSLSSNTRPTHAQLSLSSKGKSKTVDNYFAPCAATASLLLFSQGPVIVCLHHDTLAVERRFTHHSEDVQFISVDNVSERGAGRLVVSYDVAQTAIVWDLFTGGEHARFAAFEPLQVASWMRNGNVAFGKPILVL